MLSEKKQGRKSPGKMSDAEFDEYISSIGEEPVRAQSGAEPSRLPQESEKDGEEQERSELFEKWDEGIKELTQIIPDFDFAKALQNKSFYIALCRGMSIAGAYLKAKLDSENGKAAPAAKRIPENGVMRAAAGGNTRRNPADMSDKDFGEYIKSIMGKYGV